MRRELKILWFISLGFLFSCSENHDFHATVTFDNEWAYSDSLYFDFNIADTSKNYQLGAELVWNIEEYPYQNCYFRVITLMPNGERQSDLINLDFLNKQGVSLGKCRSNSCKTKYILQPKIQFDQLGEYRIAITQETRQELLPGIEKYSIYLDVME